MLPFLLAWPSAPLVEQNARVDDLLRWNKGQERTMLEDRQVLGTWYDGRIRREAETALLISPAFASRWLHWAQAHDHLAPEETVAKWNRLRGSFDGSITWFVRLASLEKTDALDFGVDSTPDSTTLRNLTWSVNVSAAGQPAKIFTPEVSIQRTWQGYEPGPLLDHSWYFLSPSLQPFLPTQAEEATPGVGDDLPLGPDFVVWFQVRVPFRGPADKITLTIRSADKVRIAKWGR